ncbi:MAG: NAD(P)H-dependent oxidoreductase [Alphaproteobacteria bacterium]|nr:NAD(P)H-dependent oxidoreductase [Alphaproteobacteria bacterium]
MGLLAGVASADAKTLVAYYSRSGNTGTVAEIIKNATGADIFEITTLDANHYPAEYRPATEVAKAEIENGEYPAIASVPDMTQYDTVFVGTPCWWGTMAGPVHTFLTTADLSGKTVVPFNTHEGSGAGTVHADIEKLTPNSAHKTGIAIRGSVAADAGGTVGNWLTEIGLN